MAGMALLLSAAAPTPMLFIGNSYTFFNDLPGMVSQIAAELPTPVAVVVNSSTMGGAALWQHANASTAAGRSTAAMLQGQYRFIVLQDQSECPGGGRDVDAGLPPTECRHRSIAALAHFFRPRLRGATPVLYQ